MKTFTVDLMGTGRMLILGEEGVNSGREALEKLLRRSFHSCDLPVAAGHHHGPGPVGILVDDVFVMRVQGTGTPITHLVADAGRGMWTVAESTRVHPAHPEYRPLTLVSYGKREGLSVCDECNGCGTCDTERGGSWVTCSKCRGAGKRVAP